MVVINNNPEKQKINTNNRLSESLNGYQSGTDVVTNKKWDINKDLEIEGKSVFVFELN